MLEKLKNISIVSKILFVIALGLFVFWVVPMITNYYSNVSKYEKKVEHINSMMSQYNVHSEAKIFNIEEFKKEIKSLFIDIEVENIVNDGYKVNIILNQNDINSFNNYLEKLSLKYLVAIEDALEFEEKDEKLVATLNLKAL